MFVNVSHYIVLWAVIVTHPIHLVLSHSDPKIMPLVHFFFDQDQEKPQSKRTKKIKWTESEEDRWERFVGTVWSHAMVGFFSQSESWSLLEFLKEFVQGVCCWELPPVILLEDTGKIELNNLTFLQLPNDFEALDLLKHPLLIGAL